MPTIGGIALSNGRRVPTRDAVVDGSRCWSWAELDRAIAVAAASMAGRGLRKGDRLAIVCANSAEFVIASHAASRLGLIVVPVNTRLAPPEIRYILEDSGAAVLAHDAAHAEPARTAVSTIRSTRLGALGCDDGAGDLIDDGVGRRCRPISPMKATTRSSCTRPAPRENRKVCCWTIIEPSGPPGADRLTGSARR